MHDIDIDSLRKELDEYNHMHIFTSVSNTNTCWASNIHSIRSVGATYMI